MQSDPSGHFPSFQLAVSPVLCQGFDRRFFSQFADEFSVFDKAVTILLRKGIWIAHVGFFDMSSKDTCNISLFPASRFEYGGVVWRVRVPLLEEIKLRRFSPES